MAFSVLRSLVINVYIANSSVKCPADFDVNKSYQHFKMNEYFVHKHCFVSKFMLKEGLKPCQRIVKNYAQANVIEISL